MPELKEKLEQLLNTKFEEEGYTHLFVVDILQSPNDSVQVFIDSDEGLNLDHCTEISRYLENHIEENNWLGEKYTLEVSSPGVGSPLKLKRQYFKNIGRTVSVELNDDHKHVKGVLKEVEDKYIVIEYMERVKIDGKKKKKDILVEKQVPFDNIKKTVVKITF